MPQVILTHIIKMGSTGIMPCSSLYPRCLIHSMVSNRCLFSFVGNALESSDLGSRVGLLTDKLSVLISTASVSLSEQEEVGFGGV